MSDSDRCAAQETSCPASTTRSLGPRGRQRSRFIYWLLPALLLPGQSSAHTAFKRPVRIEFVSQDIPDGAIAAGINLDAGSVSGHWIGFPPNGVGFAPESGTCNANVSMDLSQAGASVTGTAVVRARDTGCVNVQLFSFEQTTAVRFPNQLVGTATAGMLSFNMIMARTNFGIPNAFAIIVTSGSVTTSTFMTSGTYVPLRSWVDTNHNGIPDCDYLNPVFNGECGAVFSPAGIQSVTVGATLATPPFTDEVLTAGSSMINAVHIFELRTRIDALRARFGLPGFGWTDPSLGSGTAIMAVHVTDLRQALQEAYTAAGLSAPTLPAFTDPTFVPGTTSIKVAHVQEPRDAVFLLEES